MTLLAPIDAILRGTTTRDVRRDAKAILAIAIAGGMIYGAVMGSLTGLPEGRQLQLLFSAIKVPILLLVTFLISLPSFFVVNTLLGLRSDFRLAMSALLDTQAGLAITLFSLAPITIVWYLTSQAYQVAILFNGLMFGISAFAGQIILRRSYAPLIARNPRHRIILRAWIITYAFVGIQMGYVLRPFIGDPAQPVRFFREEAWGNAYVVVAKMIWNIVTGGA
jgi:hypothetical protein